MTNRTWKMPARAALRRGSRALILLSGVSLAAAGLSGCGGLGNALGLGKSPPDEFAVVKKAPLVMPPDYALRPPKPGMPRPQELQPSETARLALLGNESGATPNQPSQGEMLLLENANAERTDPQIRSVLNEEGGHVKVKDQAFADMVIFYEPTAPIEGQKTSVPVGDVSAQDLPAPSQVQTGSTQPQAEIGGKEKKGFWGKVTGGIF